MKLTAQSNNRELIWHQATSNEELMKRVKEEIIGHPTKQTVQTESGEGLSKGGNCSASPTEAKTDDIIMTGCPAEMEDIYGNDSK